MNCNPLIVIDTGEDGTRWYSVWCRSCKWESDATTWWSHAQMLSKQHKERRMINDG